MRGARHDERVIRDAHIDSGCPDTGESIGAVVPVALHLDLDCFFAQAEARRDTRLVGRPVAVGNPGARGIVATASYEARACGVRTAMPMAEARRLCPELVVIPPEFSYYKALSWEVAAAVAEGAPTFERYGLDEVLVRATAPLDGLEEWARHWARDTQRRVRARAGLVAAVGVAPTPVLAKLACEPAKPGGVYVVTPATLEAFLAGLSLAAIPGVGPVSAARLEGFGLITVRDAWRAGHETVCRALGERAGEVLWAHLHGEEPAVPSGSGSHSLGHERTLEADVTERAAFAAALEQIETEALARLWRSGYAAAAVVVKVRSAGFEDHSITRSLGAPTVAAPVIHAAVASTAEELFARAGGRVRLIGVSFVRLGPAVQLSLEGGNSELAGVPPSSGTAVHHTRFGAGVVVCGDEECAVVRFADAVRVLTDPRRYLDWDPEA